MRISDWSADVCSSDLFSAGKPLDMLVSTAAKICDAPPAKKFEIPLNTGAHCASAKLAKFLAILLAVDDCFFQCISIPVLRNGGKSFKWQCCGDSCSSGAVEGEGL